MLLASALDRDDRWRRELGVYPRELKIAPEIPVPIDATKFLLDLTVDSARETTLLHHAVARRDLLIARLLLAAGASPEVKMENGCSCIHIASAADDVDMVALLLGYGASHNALTINGNTSFLLAANSGSMNVLQLLATLYTRDSQHIMQPNMRGVTPLHVAAYRGHIDIVKQILEWLTAKDGNSSWLQASKELSKTGRVPKDGMSIGSYKFRSYKTHLRKSKKCARKILPELSMQTDRGITALMCASYHRFTNIMCLLSKHMSSAQMQITDADGRTAADYARSTVVPRASGLNARKREWLLDPLI